MRRGPTGTYVASPALGGEVVRSFVPHPLPPSPPLAIGDALREEIDRALLAIGRLDSVSTLLPDTSLFLYMYVRKEAVLSSQIEGTKSSLSDLLLFEIDEAPGVPFDDVNEVSNYVRALHHGMSRIGEEFPISNRLFCEIHAVLLERGRGSEKRPGEFRTSQNWIGGPRPGVATYVPPPPDRVVECMSDLEKYLHDRPQRTPPLIKSALAHVQFESVHPFLDGNGRLGRLLVTLLLCSEKLLAEPLLYLSLYFKKHRRLYYELLQQVRTEGDWEAWLSFFVAGVRETAEEATTTARRLALLFQKDRERIESVGRVAGSALRVLPALQKSPILSIAEASKRTRLTVPTVTKVFDALVKEGVLREITGKRRNRLFLYERYVAILNEGT
jgi:cell filamentation protein, protein adenylyltransferase